MEGTSKESGQKEEAGKLEVVENKATRTFADAARGFLEQEKNGHFTYAQLTSRGIKAHGPQPKPVKQKKTTTSTPAERSASPEKKKKTQNKNDAEGTSLQKAARENFDVALQNGRAAITLGLSSPEKKITTEPYVNEPEAFPPLPKLETKKSFVIDWVSKLNAEVFVPRKLQEPSVNPDDGTGEWPNQSNEVGKIGSGAKRGRKALSGERDVATTSKVLHQSPIPIVSTKKEIAELAARKKASFEFLSAVHNRIKAREVQLAKEKSGGVAVEAGKAADDEAECGKEDDTNEDVEDEAGPSTSGSAMKQPTDNTENGNEDMEQN